MPKKRHWFFDPYKYKIRVGVRGEYPNGHLIRTHSHPWHQLTFAPRGVLTVRTPDGTWIVPPHRAVWVPARTRHSVQTSGTVVMHALYIVPSFGASLPGRCRVLGVSPLLRELIHRVGELKWLDPRRPAQAHLAAVLLDEIRVLEAEADVVNLAMPHDSRARRVASLLQENLPSRGRLPSYPGPAARASVRSNACSSRRRDWASADGVNSSDWVILFGCSRPATR